MIKIESPFTLAERPPRYLRVLSESSSLAEFTTKTLILAALEVSLQIGGRSYELSSTGSLFDSGFRRHGFAWARQIVPIGIDMSLEQQIFLANAGNTVIASWRLSGSALLPLRLTASPIFTSPEPPSSEGFCVEPESSGGRVLWQPFRRASNIVADTNGRPVVASENQRSDANQIVPGAFEFELARRPALLILSADASDKSRNDPLLGALLAEIASPVATEPKLNLPARLAAA